jgi:hypothetical protein
MADDSDEEPVGRGHPPKHSRWVKGTTGNRKRQYARHKISPLELIEKELAQLIPISSANGDHKVIVANPIDQAPYRRGGDKHHR